ncbi:PVC-type heme-binding CxxCH protein [Rosistilla oblonga]|uniref:PVC-type heme-binding CxxCH protein n=1 Tax=Rosistilla oblonga TaxID=2527990 RepID=UPI003A9695BF
MLRIYFGWIAAFWCGTLLAQSTTNQHDATQDNPVAYLDAYSDSYYPHADFAKLTTPQWVGEPGVEAVVTLGIDDMRDTAKYETYLRPILNRLKQIDGRAPVSIMSCQVDPADPQLQAWLEEGLSIETHTVDHPCPCLQAGDFAKAKSTYDRCVDLMSSIPNSRPVAFRFPCMDSQNTPSPRGFAEIINKTTPGGNFLQASTSVVCVFTSRDPQLPRSLTLTEEGEERFGRYIPFPSFVNKIENYPYPYVIGKLCWEFPCTIPDDWQAQNIQQPKNPRTVDDMVAAIDATVIKQGIANIVFHPYEWIRSEQIAEVVDRVNTKYGKRVKFLTFKECIDRINKNLLADQPLRRPDGGGDNGVRVVDLNRDGFVDVMIGNEDRKLARIWQPKTGEWRELESPVQFTAAGEANQRVDLGVRFGQLSLDASVSLLVNNAKDQAIYRVSDDGIERSPLPESLAAVKTSVDGVDQGVRMRDLDRDGISEVLVANEQTRQVYSLDSDGNWKSDPVPLPFAIVDETGGDNGLRFVDLDKDGYDDMIVSNTRQSAIRLYDSETGDFTRDVEPATEIPLIVRGGTNNGAWFAADHMWLQNEDTHRLPDGVDRRTFAELIGNADPGPRSPDLSWRSIQVRPGFTVELVAAEPLVMDPVALDWGPDGKLWVAEMADYPLGLDDKGKPGGRVRYLEDTDGDGTYDKSTLFLDNIPYPTGVIAYRDGVIVSAAPTIFYAADSDDDGTADTRTELYHGFTQGNQQHLVNGFERGLDNWLYLANGDSGGTVESKQTGKTIDIRGQDLRIRPEDGSLDVQAGQTQFGRHRDDHGNWFGCNNSVPVRHYVFADHYLRRNPLVAPPASGRNIARLDNTQLFPISRVLSHWSGYKPPVAGSGHQFTSACSTMVYRDELLGPEFQQNTFTCEPVHNAVHRRQLVPQGVTFESVRPADEAGIEFMASSDSWFRPSTVTTGPDGALWVADMYRLVIEHPEWIDDQREKELFLRAGHDRGRIYRIYPSDKKPRPIAKLGPMSNEQLVAQLASPNGRTRDLAQAILIDRADASVVPRLQATVKTSEAPLARLHAICTLDGLDALNVATLQAAIADPHPTVRRHAIRLSETFLANGDTASDELLSALIACDANDPHVRLQLAYSLGFSESPRATQLLAKIASDSVSDGNIRAAVISSLSPQNLASFHEAIEQYPAAAKAFQSPILQMAVRSKDAKFLSQRVGEMIAAIDGKPTADQLDSLSGTLASIRRQNVSLSEVVQSQIDRIVRDATTWATDPDADVPHRVAAIEMIASLGNSTNNLLGLVDAAEPIEVQVAASRVLAAKQPTEILERLESLSPSVRTAILETVLSREASALILIDALQTKRLPPQTLGASQRQQLASHASAKVKAAAVKLFGESSSAADKQMLMKQYQTAGPQHGDASRGVAIFTKHCAACHRVREIGHPIGPDLTSLKDRSPVAMLTAILDPNAAVEDKYRGYSVLTIDGVATAGIIANESSTAIELQMQEGKRKTILREDIEQIQNTGTSLMPEGFEKLIPVNQMNDLLAFLDDVGPPAKQFDGNHPTTVLPTADGNLSLTATASRIYGDRCVFESKYKNIGHWGSPRDRAEWTLEVAAAGSYEVWLDYACADGTAGNRFQFRCGNETLTGTVASTGSWDDYQQVKIGVIELPASTLTASLQATEELKKWLMDLRAITLKPVQ